MLFACRNIHLQEDTTQFPDMSSESEETDSDLDVDLTSCTSDSSLDRLSDTEEQLTDTEEQLTLSDTDISTMHRV